MITGFSGDDIIGFFEGKDIVDMIEGLYTVSATTDEQIKTLLLFDLIEKKPKIAAAIKKAVRESILDFKDNDHDGIEDYFFMNGLIVGMRA